MAVRLVVTITTVTGKGSDLANGYRERCAEVMGETGCEQFEVFRSVLNEDKLILLEKWADQRALDLHAAINRRKAQVLPELRQGSAEREDYVYNRTR